MPHKMEIDTNDTQKTSSITKLLRTRGTPLLTLLPTARDLYNGTNELFFPRRNEWLLEWLVQRLKEDEKEAGRAARAALECWSFLGELLEAVEPSVVAGTLRRHGFVPLVAKTMEEIKAGDIEGTTGLLQEITQVLGVLKKIAGKESYVAAAMKGSPEACSAILGGYLDVAVKLLEGEQEVDHSWTEAVTELWRGSVWGVSNVKKTSTTWAENCLRPASALLTNPNIDEQLKTILESMIAENIFSYDILYPVVAGAKPGPPKVATTDLIPLLASLRSEDIEMSGTESSSNNTHLSVLFRIAIDSQSKRSKTDPEVIGALFTALLSVISGLSLDSASPSPEGTEVIADLLAVLIETNTALPSTTLSQIITRFASLSTDAPRWSLVRAVLAIDFDSFLHPSVPELTDALFTALSKSVVDKQVTEVLELVVEGFVKARDITGFIERWSIALRQEGGVWRSDELARIFAAKVETALTAPQIVKITKQLTEEKQWVVLDALMRGIRREDTENQLVKSGVLQEMVEVARKVDNEWMAWRVLVRIGDLAPELLENAVKDAVKILGEKKIRREAVFASEVLMRVVEETDDDEAIKGVHMLLELADKAFKSGRSWNGNVAEASKENFGLVIAVAVTGGHLPVLEKIDAGHRNKFVDNLFQSALTTESVEGIVDSRKICKTLVERPEVYEFPAVKEAILAALIANLAPFTVSTEEMSAKVAKPPKVGADAGAKYDFIISCLLQYPLEALKRASRERILDASLLLDIAGYSNVRPLMFKLWRMSATSAFMATDCQAIKAWFQHPGVAPTFRRLLSHAFVNREQGKTKEYLNSLLELTSSTVKSKKLTAGELEMCWVVITEFWTHKTDEDTKSLEKIRGKFLERLAKLLEADRFEPAHLKYWRDVWALERDDRDSAVKLVARITGNVVQSWQDGTSDSDRVVEAVGLVCAVSESIEDMLNTTAFTLVATESIADSQQSELLRFYQNLLTRLPVSVHRELTLQLVNAALSPEGTTHTWSLVHLLITSTTKPDSPEELALSVDVFSHIHSLLLLALPKATTSASFLAITDSINTLLRSHPWSIIQHNLDTTISSLTLTASSSGPMITENPDTLFTALTGILSSILALHRHRIRGRYHLVVSLLQVLMTNLFTPRLSRKKTEKAIHPPWIPYSAPLSITSARALARVLQTFCDPPVSTVRSHRSELTDSDRSKERKMVGNVVGPVLETFVKRVLEERMEGEVRKELTQGIEKVLEVLGREGVRRVTARMGGEGRAVVRGLWTEFGKGRGERV
ncbi:Urb2/Npa2 family-domain-containing protein [Pyronema omphalodes]|nr:Urb2/Npa2 family-domain-containing protein [Pyronema omphalodes]